MAKFSLFRRVLNRPESRKIFVFMGENGETKSNLELIATAAAGTEAVVKRELAALGYAARTVTPGRLLFRGDAAAICRTNLWLRAGERVLIQMGSFPATDFGVLFDATAALPWEQWLPRDAEFPVKGRSHQSQLSSVPACQKIVKRAIVERLRRAHGAEHLPETGPRCAIEISLRDDVATLTLDTTGVGLAQARVSPAGGRSAAAGNAGCGAGAT